MPDKKQSIRERFAHMFDSGSVAVEEPTPEPAIVAEVAARRRALVADVRTFISTDTYRQLRKELQAQVDAPLPESVINMEAVACYTLRREGIREVLTKIDERVRMAEEMNDE